MQEQLPRHRSGGFSFLPGLPAGEGNSNGDQRTDPELFPGASLCGSARRAGLPGDSAGIKSPSSLSFAARRGMYAARFAFLTKNVQNAAFWLTIQPNGHILNLANSKGVTVNGRRR